jgi:hypothetical protein
MSLTKTLCIAAVVIAIAAVPVYAEVQNVKVSGDITLSGVYQDDLDLKAPRATKSASDAFAASTAYDDQAAYYFTITRVRVDADLTDNVSTAVRLTNSRGWGTDGANSSDLNVDLANVTLKEMLYAPLTVTIGRQDLAFGQGFIVGPGILADPDAVFTSAAGVVNQFGNTYATYFARQRSPYNSFDAIRATLDYAPWTIDLVTSKINETALSTDSDQDLYGVNVGYKWNNKYMAEAEGYWFFKRDNAAALTVGLRDGLNSRDILAGTNQTIQPTNVQSRTYENVSAHVIGGRGSIVPIQNLTLAGEVAYQFGKIKDENNADKTTTAGVAAERDINAWAFDLSGKYSFANVKWTPELGLGWVYFTGRKYDSLSGDYKSWVPMYRGKTYTYIADYLGGVDVSANDWGYQTVDPNDTAATTNRNMLLVDGSVKPMEDVTVTAGYRYIWFAEKPAAGRDTACGQEIDTAVTYDYTRDVQFSLMAGWFIPGDYYDGQSNTAYKSNDNASVVVGSCKVTF